MRKVGQKKRNKVRKALPEVIESSPWKKGILCGFTPLFPTEQGIWLRKNPLLSGQVLHPFD